MVGLVGLARVVYKYYGFYVLLVPTTTRTKTIHESLVNRLTCGCKPVKILIPDAALFKIGQGVGPRLNRNTYFQSD